MRRNIAGLRVSLSIAAQLSSDAGLPPARSPLLSLLRRWAGRCGGSGHSREAQHMCASNLNCLTLQFCTFLIKRVLKLLCYCFNIIAWFVQTSFVGPAPKFLGPGLYSLLLAELPGLLYLIWGEEPSLIPYTSRLNITLLEDITHRAIHCELHIWYI